MLLAPDSNFSLQYIMSNGTVIAPPLTDIEVANSISAVILQVNVQGERDLVTGEAYTASLQQQIALRNLILNR